MKPSTLAILAIAALVAGIGIYIYVRRRNDGAAAVAGSSVLPKGTQVISKESTKVLDSIFGKYAQASSTPKYYDFNRQRAASAAAAAPSLPPSGGPVN